MAEPFVRIELAKIEANARAIVALCARHGIAVAGVTKCTCGDPDVARAMLRGGVIEIGESRLENVQRLRAAGVRARFSLLRVPPLSEVEHVVDAVDVSLDSEIDVLAGLSEAALQRGRRHDVILMVDLGDLREGIWPDDVPRFVAEVLRLTGVRVRGLGANLTCFGGIAPTRENMARLVELAEEVEGAFGLDLAWLSAGNSSALELVAAGGMPSRINHLRVGEAILLGRETLHRRPWPGTAQDAFTIHAEIIELKEKPSLPIGEPAEDAFGHVPHFVDAGERVRALLDIGREDVDPDGLTPWDARARILGASSDYLIVDVTEVTPSVRVGDFLAFVPNYAALLAAMTSPYLAKQAVLGGVSPGR